jgi:hypothetical protein
MYELDIAKEHLTIPRRRADSGKGSPPCFFAASRTYLARFWGTHLSSETPLPVPNPG